jgi:carbonic anhydrase
MLVGINTINSLTILRRSAMIYNIPEIYSLTNVLIFLTTLTVFFAAIIAPGAADDKEGRKKHVLTKEIRDSLSPQQILSLMKEGNRDFVKGRSIDWDYLYEQQKTAEWQYPAAIILSCIDSRAPAEIIFNLAIGDAFNARVAGNFLNTDIAGSMEYACKVAGAKVVLVMGHTNCGAVKGAIDQVELGNLTSMLQNIKPAIDAVENVKGERNSNNKAFVNAVARKDVLLTMQGIRKTSPVLSEMEDKGEIIIVGSMYDVETGKVEFFDSEGKSYK